MDKIHGILLKKAGSKNICLSVYPLMHTHIHTHTRTHKTIHICIKVNMLLANYQQWLPKEGKMRESFHCLFSILWYC